MLAQRGEHVGAQVLVGAGQHGQQITAADDTHQVPILVQDRYASDLGRVQHPDGLPYRISTADRDDLIGHDLAGQHDHGSFRRSLCLPSHHPRPACETHEAR
nr:hypothetical protein [Planobispora rosea]